MIKAISFDADVTLWDFPGVMRQALHLALAELKRCVTSSQAQALTLEDLEIVRDELASELRDQNVSHETVRRLAFERTLQQVGHDDPALAERLNDMYLDHRFSAIELYPDVPSTLASLKERYSLGLISNGNSYPDRCGLPDTFEFVLFAKECGLRKPDPRFYELMLERAGVQASEVIHVGDSLVKDVQAAQSVGIRAVWINRAGKQNISGIQPLATITSLLELPDILARL